MLTGTSFNKKIHIYTITTISASTNTTFYSLLCFVHDHLSA